MKASLTRTTIYFNLLTLTVLVFFSCTPKVAIQFPKFPQGVYGQKLKTVMQGQRTLGILAPDPGATLMANVGNFDFTEIAEGEVENAFTRRGYFEFVDLKNRKDRLRELARTQTGLTRVQKLIGQEKAVDALLVVKMDRYPKMECKIENLYDSAQIAVEALKLGVDIFARSQGHNLGIDTDMGNTRRPTGVLYLTPFIKAKLVNIETGRVVSYSFEKPFRQVNRVGTVQCPTALKALDASVKEAAKEIANHLSPKIAIHKIALEKNVGNVDSATASVVKSYLNEGMRFAKANNLEAAAEQWEEALSESGGMSAGAYWNLAAYKWYAGEMDEAQEYFTRAMRTGGPGWLTSGKRETYTLFKQELRRHNLADDDY